VGTDAVRRRSFKALGLTLALGLAPTLAQAGEVTVKDRSGAPVPDVVVRWNAPSSASNAAVVDQINKQFVPYVSVIKPGTLVSFPNSDDIRHHVYSFSEAKPFELKLYHSNDAEPVIFDKSGLVTLGCNVHDTMKAYVLVTESATALSDTKGLVTLPDQISTVEVWHPQLTDTLDWAEVTISDGIVLLPFVWSDEDPQAARDRDSLAERMQRFRKRED
jgi:plastocyanin